MKLTSQETLVGNIIALVVAAVSMDTLNISMSQCPTIIMTVCCCNFVVVLGCWSGLGPRIIMIGTLTALQWFIYDGVKVALRLPRPPPPQMPDSLKKKMQEK